MNFKPGYPHGMSTVGVLQVRSEKETGTLVRQTIQVNALMDILVGRKLTQKLYERRSAFNLHPPRFIGEHEFDTDIASCGVQRYLHWNNSGRFPAHITNMPRIGEFVNEC
jgi:hypothetical protein